MVVGGRAALIVICACLGVACGSDAKSSLSNAGGDAGASTAGGAGAGAGAAGTAGSGGAGGSSGASCTGAFGAPELLFDGDTDFDTSTPNLPADELEMFYVAQDPAIPATMADRAVVRTRSSKTAAISAPTAISALNDQCAVDQEGMSLDVSEDGLRLFFTCQPLNTASNGGALHYAERPDRSSPFVLSTTTLGLVGVQFGISADELTLYAHPTGTGQTAPDLYQRASSTAPFSLVGPVPGINFEVDWPDPSHDDLVLYGTSFETSGAQPIRQLIYMQRAATSAAFSALMFDGLPAAPAGVLDAGAAISADCKSLYFLRVQTAGGTRAMYVVHR